MGLFDTSLTILLTPILLAAVIVNKLTPIKAISTKLITTTKMRRSDRVRGRLILFAIDETSLNAVQWAIDELLSPSDFVHIVHILESQEKGRGESVSFSAETLQKVSKIKGLSECCDILRSRGVKFDGRIIETGVNQTIEGALLNLIDEVQPDLVLLGSSKRTGEHDIGAIASNVALKSPTTVTLVK